MQLHIRYKALQIILYIISEYWTINPLFILLCKYGSDYKLQYSLVSFFKPQP